MGFGHLRRSVTLAHEIQSRGPVNLWILGAETPDAITDDVRYHLSKLTWSSGPHPDLSASSVKVLDLEQENLRRLLTANPSKTKHLALDWFDPSILPDCTINLLDHSGRMHAAYTAAARTQDYGEGPDYAIIRPTLLALREKSPPKISQVRRVVITPGGADPAKRGLEALHLLEAQTTQELEIVLIIGPLVPEAYENELRAAAREAVTILRNPADFDQQLAKADIILCSGGGTLLEALALGKPTVVLPQNSAEESHARSHAEAGACVFAEALPQVLGDLALRHSLSQKARQRVDGRGIERIAEIALRLLRHN